jgi:hypothetical protein
MSKPRIVGRSRISVGGDLKTGPRGVRPRKQCEPEAGMEPENLLHRCTQQFSNLEISQIVTIEFPLEVREQLA